MIKIIDATLAMLDDYTPTKEQLLAFCYYMKEIGIVDLEISKATYTTMCELPTGFRFYMYVESFDKRTEYVGIYRYYITHGENAEKVISQFQINDMKELIHLRVKSDLKQLRIIGLDDLICHDYISVMKEILVTFNKSMINFCPEDTYHCATALAVEWLITGGKEVTTSFASCGLRAATEEVYMAMNIVKRYKPNQSLEVLVQIRKLFEQITKEKIPLFKPIIGKNIFCVESGIHVDGILKKASNYEAYPPQKVGQQTKIILGKYSGGSSVINKCEQFSLRVPQEDKILKLLEGIKALSVKNGRSITDEEFLHIYEEVNYE